MSNSSFFARVDQAPPDPILGLTEAFNADSNPRKVNLGVGVYQDGSGKVPVLQTVREAENIWYNQETSKSYLPIDGLAAFNNAVKELLLGENSPLVSAGRVVTVQCLGGTGALKVGGDFLKRFFSASTVYISDPTWANHGQIFERAGFSIGTYTYYDKATHGLNFEGMISSLKSLPDNSIVLLHGCCHNPTGVDPTREQWKEIVEVFKNRPLVPFIDFAYQGFGDGIDEDAYAIRLFAEAGLSCLVASSFSKSLSIYRERVGALTIITGSADESKKILSQVKVTIRSNYSNPTSHGGQIAAIILTDATLRKRWEKEVTEMRERIQTMRELFVKGLKEKGVKQDFSFIAKQKGMFSFSGLTKETVETLIREYSLYMVSSGRICVAAMNEKNIPFICESIAAVLNK